MKRQLFILFILFLPFNVKAFELELPIDCKIGATCFIQNYVDIDTSKKNSDYRCNAHTYDGHKGVDFRVTDNDKIQKGIRVLAAAPGIVKAARDGMEDKNFRQVNPKEIENRECGNGVLIDHGDGFETQYCHMKKGSIFVKKGVNVEAGDKIGMIGLSGQTEFPHLHFEVRNQEKTIDPFTNREIGKFPCNPIQKARNLWSLEADQQLEYKPTRIINTGFSIEQPKLEDINNVKYKQVIIADNVPLIVFWANIIGIETGQTVQMEMFSPVGEAIVTHEKTFDKPKAEQLYYIGKRSPTKSWETGEYLAKIRIIRKNQNTSDNVIAEKIQKFTIKTPEPTQ